MTFEELIIIDKRNSLHIQGHLEFIPHFFFFNMLDYKI